MTAETSPEETARPPASLPPELRKGPPRLLVVVVIVLIVAAAMTVGMLLAGGDSPTSGQGRVQEFTIPRGAFQRVAAGEDLEVFPAELHVEVGDSIKIRNDDVVGQTVGPYYVPAGQTVVQKFTENATLEGVCTAHKDGRIRIVVGTGGEGAASSGV